MLLAMPCPQTGAPTDANAAMVLRRLKIYWFTVPLPKPAGQIPYCSRCFSDLLLQHQHAPEH